MAATNRSIDYDALLTTTSELYYKKGIVQDNVFENNIVLKKLKAKGTKTQGGEVIRAGIMTGANDGAQSYSRYEPVSVAPQNGMTIAHYPWAQYSAPVSIDGLSEFQNSGAAEIQDLLLEKTTQAAMSLQEKVNEHLMDVANITVSTGATGNDGKNLISLPLICQVDPTAPGLLGGVQQSTQPKWRNINKTNAVDTWAGIIADMRYVFNSCSRGGGGAPNLIIADQHSFEQYEAGLDSKSRYTDMGSATAGFEKIYFKTAEMYWDSYVPDMAAGTNGVPGTALTNGSMFFLNTKFLDLVCGKGKDFKPTPFRTPVDQDARVQLILFYGNLITNNRRKQGLINSILASIAS